MLSLRVSVSEVILPPHRLDSLTIVEDFTEKFPDAQMIEVIQFIIGSLPTQNGVNEGTGREARFVVTSIRFDKR